MRRVGRRAAPPKKAVPKKKAALKPLPIHKRPPINLPAYRAWMATIEAQPDFAGWRTCPVTGLAVATFRRRGKPADYASRAASQVDYHLRGLEGALQGLAMERTPVTPDAYRHLRRELWRMANSALNGLWILGVGRLTGGRKLPEEGPRRAGRENRAP